MSLAPSPTPAIGNKYLCGGLFSSISCLWHHADTTRGARGEALGLRVAFEFRLAIMPDKDNRLRGRQFENIVCVPDVKIKCNARMF